ncbi:MAG: iron ABC transporter permease [Aphanocapsa sp. GSE-SYN-MK-11-07L]|jgi:iron complex transport system permease protein|nr:iron ABC transporter permease [Aphanocapsa sp. GSE-SYN-MK-11-07L]
MKKGVRRVSNPWLILRSSRLAFSVWLDHRVPWVLLGLSLVTLGVIAFSLSYGEYPIPPFEVIKTILRWQATDTGYYFVINILRLPRIIVAFGVGTGLAIAGAILQGITRNSLASPEIVGVEAGAGLAAVILIVLFPAPSVFLLPMVAFVGALVAALLVYGLSWEEGSSSLRLILVGIGVGAIASALTTLMITFGNIDDVSQALVWLAGSVSGRSWDHVQALLPWLLIFLPLSFVLSRHLSLLTLGDEIARGLGAQVEWQRGVLLLTSVALAGASVATAGAIGFVGLMAPHLARQLVGTGYAGLLPTSAVIGGLMVVSADLLGRLLFAPIELPCGILTAAVGAPYFLYLLYRSRDEL